MRLLLPKCQSLALRLFFLLLIIHLKIVAALSFTQSPRAVQYNSTYSIEWSTGDHNKVCLARTLDTSFPLLTCFSACYSGLDSRRWRCDVDGGADCW